MVRPARGGDDRETCCHRRRRRGAHPLRPRLCRRAGGRPRGTSRRGRGRADRRHLGEGRQERRGSDTITARLFIQWIAYDDAGGAKLEETVEIKEFADLKLDIVDYTSDSDTDGLSVYLETVNPESDADESYELFVFSPTDYRLGPATN
jgi:hypothetical protein